MNETQSCVPFSYKGHGMLVRMRYRALIAVLISTLIGGPSLFAEGSDSDKHPNLVFLMSDDQCTYSMGGYGTPGAKTPHLDALARDGMVFDNHYVTTAICMASRACVMTGKHEYRAGCNFDSGPLLAEHWENAYPMLLREAGYTTAFAGKFGFEVAEQADGPAILPESDFDRWGGGPGQTFYETRKNRSMAAYAEEYPHATRSYGAFGRDFIHASAESEKPFCLSISFKAPHHPVQPDPIFDDVYAGASFAKPANFGREHGEHFSPQSRQGRQYERFHSWNYSSDYDGVMAKYYQQIYAIDVAVGMIRQALTDAGVAENTVIIYTSDNGFLCGSHGYGSKVLPYEESSRVPLIVYDPRHRNSGQGLRCAALTANADFAPTLLALAGITLPDDLDGRDLMPLYDDPTARHHDSLPLINVWGPQAVHSLAVVTTDWKYIYWPYSEGEFEPTEELYHLATDRLELENLANDAASAAADLTRMRRQYDHWLGHWKERGVRYHGYPELVRRFERR